MVLESPSIKFNPVAGTGLTLHLLYVIAIKNTFTFALDQLIYSEPAAAAEITQFLQFSPSKFSRLVKMGCFV